MGAGLGFVYDIGGGVGAARVASSAVAARVSVPRTTGAGIGRSNFRSINEFGDAAFDRYQQFYDQGFSVAQGRVAAGRLANNDRDIGNATDRYARLQVRRWLANEGIEEGAGGIIHVNRWLRDPTAGSSAYCIPDVRIPGANISLDGTIGWKSATTAQIRDFRLFSGGDNVTIVRPTQEGGSYGVVFP